MIAALLVVTFEPPPLTNNHQARRGIVSPFWGRSGGAEKMERDWGRFFNAPPIHLQVRFAPICQRFGRL